MSPSDTRDLAGLIAALPKTELHLHLVGAANTDVVNALARRHPGTVVPTDPDALRRLCHVPDFDRFITVFGAVTRLITTPADVVMLVERLAADLTAGNVRYAEVTVTPLSHVNAGIDPDALAEALTEGRRLAATRHGVELAWIFDISGDDGVAAGHATVDWVLGTQPAGTVALGLGGPERGVPRAWFKEPFAKARASGLRSVPHAGETTDAAEVAAAIDVLGADRIGHGIRAATDPGLLERLATENITLEVCPTSNVRTGSVDSLTNHPLPELRAAGVPVAISTDDPGIFCTTLNHELEVCADWFGMSGAELADMVRTGVRAAFCSETRRHQLLREIDDMLGQDDATARGADPNSPTAAM